MIFNKDLLQVKILESREQMGRVAAQDGAALIRSLLDTKPIIHVMFAAAPSQNELLAALRVDPTIDWSRVHAYHMDEYIDLPEDHPAGFRKFLRTRLFDLVPFCSVNYLNGNAAFPEEEALRYSGLLQANPLDICFCGIGENGHLAFNDPPVANFLDSKMTKIVKLDETCRMQQVHDGCFDCIDEVPTHALTVTIPGLLAAKHILCVVPAATKAEAVFHTLNDPISEACPATVLRTHPDATLYLDPESSRNLQG